MSDFEEQSPQPCPEIVKPTVVESCPECAEGYLPSNCVTTSTAFPSLQIGKGTSLTNALSKISNFVQANTHEQNTDSKLKTMDGFTVIVDDLVYPRATCEFNDVSTNWLYTSGVIDSTGFGGEKSSTITAINSVIEHAYSISATEDRAALDHSISGVTTAGIRVENARVRLRTAEQIAGTINVGDKVVAINIDGTIEFESGSWTTALRPSTPYNGRSGFNTDLLQCEYWNGTTWIQY